MKTCKLIKSFFRVYPFSLLDEKVREEEKVSGNCKSVLQFLNPVFMFLKRNPLLLVSPAMEYLILGCVRDNAESNCAVIEKP